MIPLRRGCCRSLGILSLLACLFGLREWLRNDKIHVKKSAIPEHLSPAELSDLAQLALCPVCFGRDMCGELSRPDVKVSREFVSPGRIFAGASPVYKSNKLYYWLHSVAERPRYNARLEIIADFACRNGSLIKKSSGDCDVSLAAQNSFLYYSTLDKDLLPTAFVAGWPPPMSVCSSTKKLQALVRTFDENADNTLTADEKVTMLTTLSAWPEVAVYRFLARQDVVLPTLPFLGTCGRLAVVEPGYVPLTVFLDKSLDVRKGLAVQVLRLFDSFLNSDAHWLFVTSAVTMDNLAVTPLGQVVLYDMSDMFVIERPRQPIAATEACDLECLQREYEALSLTASDSADACRNAYVTGEVMLALACKRVLRNERVAEAGLLRLESNEDVLGEEVLALLLECEDESETGARKKAVDSLMELLSVPVAEER